MGRLSQVGSMSTKIQIEGNPRFEHISSNLRLNKRICYVSLGNSIQKAKHHDRDYLLQGLKNCCNTSLKLSRHVF